MAETKDDFKKRADPPAEVESLRQQLSKALRESRRLKTQVGDDQRLFEAIKDEIKALEPLKPQPIPRPKLKHDPLDALLFLADAHSEEVVRPEEVEGLAEYNWDIFTRRSAAVVEKTVELVTIQRQASEVKRLWVCMLGDWFLGEIHPDETAWGSSMPLARALPKAAQVCANQIRRLAPHFDEVVCVGMVGNHGRSTAKPVTKMTAERNWDFSVYLFAQAMTEEIENVRWILPESRAHVIDVFDWKVLLTHGDMCRQTHVTPYFGILNAIKGEHQTRRKTDKDFDWAYMGHWHHHGLLEGEVTICPPLIGHNQFSQYQMHRKSKAQQLLEFYSEKHGRTCSWPINL